MLDQLLVPHSDLAAFCQRWGVRQLSLFGSVLGENFRPASDVDVLVTFEDSPRPSRLDLVDMQEELQSIFHRRVDLLSRRGVEESLDPIRRRAIPGSAVPVYGA